MSAGTYTTAMEAIPTTAGFLPLPRVTLYKYYGTKKKTNGKDNKNQVCSKCIFTGNKLTKISVAYLK